MVGHAPYRFGQFELNPATRQLLANGVEVFLGARAFDVLLALIERRERLVTKNELLEAAWPGLVVEENNLQVQISALRKALGSHAIVTIPGRGYRFAVNLENDAPPATDQAHGASERQEAPKSAVPSPPSWPRTDTGGAGVEPARYATSPWRRLVPIGIVLVIALAGGWHVVQRDALPPRIAPAPMPGVVDPQSLAVLPFANMSDDKDAAYFADGVQDDLLTQLAMIGDLKVISRTSVMDYRGTRKNLRQIGAELGAKALVEGSIRRDGNRVRLSVQLIDAQTDTHLWGRSYERELKDIFAIQAEIATEIARAMKVALTRRDQAQLDRRPTANLEAYELYLRAHALDNLTTAGDVGSHLRRELAGRHRMLEEEINLLSRAVKLDPKFALAWAHLGASEARVRYFLGDPTGEWLARAQNSMDRAIGLAPDDLEVRRNLGELYYYGYQDFARAGRYVEELLELAPNHVPMLVQLAHLQQLQGRWADANALLRRAIAIDVRNVEATRALGANLFAFRQFDEVYELMRRIVELVPGNLDKVAFSYDIERWRTGSFERYDAWRKTLSAADAKKWHAVYRLDVVRQIDNRNLAGALRLVESPPEGVTVIFNWSLDAYRAGLLLALGRRDEALKLARSKLRDTRQALRSAPSDSVLQHDLMLYYAMLGQRDAAIKALRDFTKGAEVRSNVDKVENFIIGEFQVLALLGDHEQALKRIAQAVRPGIAYIGIAAVDPALASLWAHPEFRALANDPANHRPLPIENRGIPKLAM